MSPSDVEPSRERARVRDELAALFALASPLILTNVGNMAIGLVDVAVLGRLGEVAIAAAGLGNAIFFTTTLFGVGLLLGLDPLLAQAIGAGESKRAARAFVAGIALALLVAIPLGAILLFAAASSDHFGVDPDTARSAREYLHARVFSLVPFLLLMGTRSYLQARGRTRSLVQGVVAANVVNLPIAWALAHGVPSLGLEGLGVFGAGVASAIATTVQLVVAARPLAWDEELLDREARRFDRALFARAIVLGAPLGVQIVLEAGSFAVVTFLVGHAGTRALSGHQIALAVVSATFQVVLGLAAATSVRVGTAIGRGDREAARRGGLVGIASGAAFMLATTIVILLVPRALARLLTNDVDVIEASLPFLFVAACFQLGDGIQTVGQGALRGAGDTRSALVVNLFGHWVLGLPLGLFLRARLGPLGLWWGLSIGLFTVAVLMTSRFVLLTRRPIARV